MRKSPRRSPPLVRSRRGQHGQGLLEYGFIIIIIAMVVIAFLKIIGNNTSGQFCSVDKSFGGICSIYAGNTGANSALKFNPDANGNATPAATITGAATGFSGIRGMVTDSSHNLWVANSTAFSGAGSITKYTSSATGNQSPAVTIGGAATGLSAPYGLAFDGSGNLWVANRTGFSGPGSITEYLAASLVAGGNIAPHITIEGAATGLSLPTGVTFDSSGNIWVVNNTGGSGTGLITKYTTATLVAGANNAAPAVLIGGVGNALSTPNALAFNSSGTLFVSNTGTTAIFEYTPAQLVAGGNIARSAAISGAATLLSTPRGIAVDGSGNLWVGNGGNLITEYASSNLAAGGNIAPAIDIAGGNTGLNSPYALAIG